MDGSGHGSGTATRLAGVPLAEISVRKALSSQSTLLDRGEHCSLDPERMAALGLAPGRQLRVRRGDDVALYTISETRVESDPRIVRMALRGRERLGTPDEFTAALEVGVTHPTYSDEDARRFSELVERLDDDGCQRQVIAIAPHGGDIERHTDEQAERIAARLGRRHASAWRCRGFMKGGRAFAAWHITSTDISPASFPLLGTVATRGFVQAVAFHGFSEADVLVGGGAPSETKTRVAEAIERALHDASIPVRVAAESERYDGDDPANVVNRLTAGGTGLQIEQSLEARSRHWKAIADAVAHVLEIQLFSNR